MGTIGPMEWLLIAIIALVVIGPNKLPDAARSLGRGVREMRDAMSGESDDSDEEKKPAAVERS